MSDMIGVRFRPGGKVYYFSPGECEVKRNDHVIVETSRGVEYGTVVCDPSFLGDVEPKAQLKTILRIASEQDEMQEAENREKEKSAYGIALEKIAEHGLPMKLIDVEYTFDNNKVLFYFTADGRVDFRALVKDLAGVFRTRIELRQIGVRDETKIIGGIGICGRVLCCHSYLSDFIPVSIKMAKEQSLSLNPTKISGTCGRLMCCLKNEEEVYEEINKRMPAVGDTVTANDGTTGEVYSVSILKERMKVVVEIDDEKEIREFKLEEIEEIRRRKRGQRRGGYDRDKEKNASSADTGEDMKYETRGEAGEDLSWAEEEGNADGEMSVLSGDNEGGAEDGRDGSGYDVNDARYQGNDTRDDGNDARNQGNDTRDDGNDARYQGNDTRDGGNEAADHRSGGRDRRGGSRHDRNGARNDRNSGHREDGNEAREGRDNDRRNYRRYRRGRRDRDRKEGGNAGDTGN